MSLFVISLFIILKIYNSFILLTEILKGLDLQESLILALEYKVKYFVFFFLSHFMLFYFDSSIMKCFFFLNMSVLYLLQWILLIIYKIVCHLILIDIVFNFVAYYF
jgi:hypothetical protein